MATTYPTTTDLSDHLTQIDGAPSSPSEDILAAAIEDGIETAERLTRRVFSSSGNSETRTYDGITGNIGKDRIVEIDDCYDLTAVSVDGNDLTEDTDYVLLPRRRRDGKPIEAIQFIGSTTPFKVGSLSVAATFGWETLPATIKKAILDIAAVSILKTNSAATGQVIQRKIGDRQIIYGVSQAQRSHTSEEIEEAAVLNLIKFQREPYA
ncbi:MAG: hypothetical protein JST51_01500 [Armatimonadetes bacterium]|nr:hypothetical protein [Armatimonadota bacterium]